MWNFSNRLTAAEKVQSSGHRFLPVPPSSSCKQNGFAAMPARSTFHCRFHPSGTAAGKVTGISKIARDITQQKRMEQQLRDAHEELKTAQNELVDTARQAGMAEVAVGVLHNVGNVLNSVNVTTTIIGGKMRKSKAQSLGKIVAMLREHEGKLGEFLEKDAKGIEVLSYLEKLSQVICTEQRDVLSELETLAKNVEHMKEIVSAQQSYATAVPLVEFLSAGDLLEDAQRINLTSLGRHQVKIEKNYSDSHHISGDKHKVLQILVNLINNAKQAMGNSEIKILTLSTRVGPAGRIQISVSDTGCGIHPDNLNRIFSHGFTTKKGGHGFGLHSSVLAAREMKGSLTVQSEGPGRGTTFTLELPAAMPLAAAA